jgi:hypothetical protein
MLVIEKREKKPFMLTSSLNSKTEKPPATLHQCYTNCACNGNVETAVTELDSRCTICCCWDSRTRFGSSDCQIAKTFLLKFFVKLQKRNVFHLKHIHFQPKPSPRQEIFFLAKNHTEEQLKEGTYSMLCI